MKPQVIATDVPEWLKTILNTIQWTEMSDPLLFMIEKNVQLECSRLMRKQSGYTVYHFNTWTPSEILEYINEVDFMRLSPEDEEKFKDKVKSNVQLLGITL